MLTLTQVAERYGVTPETVRLWVRTGEMVAINTSRSARSQKPRWKVSETELAAFDRRRSSKPEPATPRPARRPASMHGVIEFIK